MRRGLLVVLVAALLSACSTNHMQADGSCSRSGLVIDAAFEGGDFDACKLRRDNHVTLTIHAEDDKVSDAFSWFAFRARSEERTQLQVKLRFPDSYARFWPKISADGRKWEYLDRAQVSRSRKKKTMRFTVIADPDGTFVAAQELLTLAWYDAWLSALEAEPTLDVTDIGRSLEGHPIRAVRSSDSKPEIVVLIGRQHPGEVPGAMAMRSFVDAILNDGELARRFRERFALLIVPLLNPDGVVNGHARHNAGMTDLNRDWGPFTQPETSSVAAVLDELDAAGIQPKLMLDFHATRMTSTMIFYTQLPEDRTHPPKFATRWLDRVDNRIDNYAFTHAPRPASDQANAKNYFFRRYGIPAITYEIGDEADRSAITRYTPVFAEEMMRVLLGSD